MLRCLLTGQLFMGTLFIFHKGLHRVAASLKTSHLRQPKRLREGFPYEEKSMGSSVHDANLLRRKSLQLIFKNEKKKLNIIMLEHVFVPRVRVFDPIEGAKPTSFGSCHRSDQEWSFPLAVHLPLQLVLWDAAKHEVTLFDLPRPCFLVAPPSGLLLVFAEIDSCLCVDGFDCVDSWLHVFLGILYSVGRMPKLFWGYCFFAIEERLEGCKLCCP